MATAVQWEGKQPVMEDLFGGKDDQKQQAHWQMEQMKANTLAVPGQRATVAGASPPGSTLPSFDAFTQFEAAAGGKPYKTPFDSPSPTPSPLQNTDAAKSPQSARVDGESASASSFSASASKPRTGGADSIPTSRTTRAQSVANQFDYAGSIFARATEEHDSNQSASAATLATPGKQAAPRRSPRPIPPAVIVDPREEAVVHGLIPDIVANSAWLARRASEPTLGSRREKAAQDAALASVRHKQEVAGVPRRLSISTKADVINKDDASNINLDPLSLRSPVTPRHSCAMCSSVAFAKDRCATHLTEQFENGADGRPSTPTTVLRKIHSLWQRNIVNKPNGEVELTWRFWKKSEFYVIQVWEASARNERTVLVNGKTNYRGHPESGPWKLSMVLGKSKSSAFEVLLEAAPRSAIAGGTGSAHLYKGDYEFEIWLDGFPFAEAQNNFMSELGVAQQSAMLQSEDADDGVAAGKRKNAKAMQYDAMHYIQTNWSRTMSTVKTSMGYPKHSITWRFTLSGSKHTLVLVHSEKSGKRTITLDGKLLFSHKPSWLNGLLLQRSSSQKLELENVKLEVRIQKLTWSTSASSSSSSASHPNFAYDLLIDGVSYNKCIKTLAEYGGGMIDVEATLKEQHAKAARKKRREMELARDPRVQLSPE